MSKRAVTISDLQQHARRTTPDFAYTLVDTAAGEGHGVRGNVAAFDRLRLGANALAIDNEPDTGAMLFGRRYSAPFGIAPMGRVGTLRRGADQMLALAARQVDVPLVLSGLSCATIEEIAAIAPDHSWQQLYPGRTWSITADMARRAGDCGVQVLVLTVDVPAAMYNHWLARRGINLSGLSPVGAWPRLCLEAIRNPRWTYEHAVHGGLPPLDSVKRYFPDAAGSRATASAAFAEMLSLQSWQIVEKVRTLWPGKLVVKGIMTAQDADRAAALGADAIVISNHGGNKLDVIAPSLCALSEIARHKAWEIPLLFDGGIRRGSDVAIALALGASFCLVGRAPLFGAMASGEAGARRALDILQDELRRTLLMTGCPTLADLKTLPVHRFPLPH